MSEKPPPKDDVGALEKARERLYSPTEDAWSARLPFLKNPLNALPHEWKDTLLPAHLEGGERHVRLATIFLGAAAAFFVVALVVAGLLISVGGNSVSGDKITIDVEAPTSITGGDTVPLAITIVNRNLVALENATIEIDFPPGTKDAADVSEPYPHYVEQLGTLGSGERVTRSIKAVFFGASGQTLMVPISLSYGTKGSNAVFVKKYAYTLTVSSTPLEVSVDTLTETVSGKPLTLTLTVRSNATTPLSNVVLLGALPFGFTPVSSSIPFTNSAFLLGTLQPGQSKTITLTGTLTGQNNEQRVFRFSIGTATSPKDQTLAVTYLTQDATVTIAAPFISTALSLNGSRVQDAVITPDSHQNVSVRYTNTLPTSIEHARVEVKISGSAIDYDSIRTSSGFYNSSTRTIVFSGDTDPSLESLSSGASGVGAFGFSTLPADELGPSPAVSFTVSVSGTRIGQTSVPEQVSASMTETAKVRTLVLLTASALHSSGPFNNSGPIPPVADEATTYTIVWGVQNTGSTIAGATVSATLPSYVMYTSNTNGSGLFSYNESSRVVTWTIGDVPQGGSITGAFQVSLTPSTSQKGGAPALTSSTAFTGYDRFAGVQLTASADPVTTETRGDPGYRSDDAVVQ
jgi:hypothetical protein